MATTTIKKGRGRPPKQPIAKRIETALDVAQEEINQYLPVVIQNQLVPVVQSPEVIVEQAPKISQDATDDYDFARNNLHNLLKKGNEVLDGINSLCNDSESPRAFEVAGNILKVLLEGTRELMTLQKDIREVEKKSVPATGETPMTIDNVENMNVLEVSTMEMLDILEEKRRRKEIKEHTI